VPVAVTLPSGERRTYHHEVAIPCPDCSQRKRAARIFKSSHLTEGFGRLTFESFRPEERPQCVRGALAAVLDYVERFSEIRFGPHNSVALLGPPGCGKTHLLTATANRLLARGISVHYFPWVEGSNELREDLDKISVKLEAMRRADVLYVDDLFKGRRAPTDFQLEFLFDVVNYRYLNFLPILVSSERDFDAICEIDEGIGSRIFERARDHTVILRAAPGEKSSLNYRLEGDK
jgi:DNA replication protein DnaC